jgi:predicted dehydrogenase
MEAFPHMTPSITVAVAGVTGRMGTTRHLRGALEPLARDGLTASSGGRPVPIRLVLVGRDEAALRQLATATNAAWSTDLDSVLGDRDVDVYFDARRPDVRPSAIRAAIQAGKHVYAEKPLALDATEARALEQLAKDRGVKTGIVHDKLFTPGYRALRGLLETSALGQVLDVRGSFGYWVHDGTGEKPQRPSWNYRREAGGSLIADIFSHFSYLLELVGRPVAVAALTATHVTERRDEAGSPYLVTVEDTAHVLVRMNQGATAVVSTSWVERPLTPFTLVVHGREASARTTPTRCWVTAAASGDGAPWEGGPDGVWAPVPVGTGDEFLAQWTLFLRHVAFDEPFRWTFASAVRAASLCAAIEEAAATGRWCAVHEVPPSSEAGVTYACTEPNSAQS